MQPEEIMAINHYPSIPGWFCAGLPDHWHQAARLKLAMDVSDKYKLELKLFDIALNMKNRMRWRIKKGDDGVMMLWRLSKLAVWELTDPRRFKVHDAYKIYTGVLGINKSNWCRTWQGRYESLYRELDDWVNRAYRFIKIKAARNARAARELAAEVLEQEEIQLLRQFQKVG